MTSNYAFFDNGIKIERNVPASKTLPQPGGPLNEFKRISEKSSLKNILIIEEKEKSESSFLNRLR